MSEKVEPDVVEGRREDRWRKQGSVRTRRRQDQGNRTDDRPEDWTKIQSRLR